MQPNMPSGPYPSQPPPPSQAYSQQAKPHRGPWLILFIVTFLLFLGAAGFGVWAFAGRQDYKNNTDQKVAAAVKIAQEETSAANEAEFAEQEKNPLQPYTGPAALGSASIEYPKTWSAYVEESGNGSTPLDGYFHPDFVPSTRSDVGFAIRIQVVESDYAAELKKFESNAKNGKVKVSPYTAPNVEDTVGARVDGEIITGKKGSMVLLPVRDKTLKVWTEADQFQKDFNEIILASLRFTP